MGSERWKRAALPSLRTNSQSSDMFEAAETNETAEIKKGRRLSKALRSMSNSSIESMTPSSRSSTPMRKLQKTPSSSSASMMDRIHRRVSKDSAATSFEPPDTPIDQPYHSMEVLKHGFLKADVSLLKARSEYLVLAEQCLVKFSNADAAKAAFAQLLHSEGPQSGRSAAQGCHKGSISDNRLEIPLRSIVAVFNEEGSSPRFGVEVWWFSPWPKLAYSKAHFFFSMPKERDEWLAAIQRAYRFRARTAPAGFNLPENIRTRLNHIAAAAEPQLNGNSTTQSLIFPVARRTPSTLQKAGNAEEHHHVADISSSYFVLGPYMCHFVEVLRADYATPPGELRVKTMSFGTVTLTRFKASVASYEQRFVMTFRLPLERETRFDLASASYRRVIEAMTKVDRILKPMWPQHFQHVIFDIKGLPSPLQLTAGNDLGGLEKSLQAYCVAFSVQMPRWTIEWATRGQPMFRLLPKEGGHYSPRQLLAVFRALRYNSFFRAISFKDVNLTSLTGKKEHAQYGDSVVYTSLGGLSISEESSDALTEAPVLAQEFHALLFASESIREVDFSNILGLCDPDKPRNPSAEEYAHMRRMSSEVLFPIHLLLKHHLATCPSISLSDNPLAPNEVDDLANVLVLDHVALKKLHLANCGMGDAELSKLWIGLAGQSSTIESLDTSRNRGVVNSDILADTLRQFRVIQKLCISGNARLGPDVSLFDESVITSWALQELDLSNIWLNDATVEVLAAYLETEASYNLHTLKLNQCGLTGAQIARLFRGMGQARRMTVHLNANRLDSGIDDLCGVIACGYGPWSLFMQMEEFATESSYVKLLRSLMVNKTIQCLSLAGSSTPDAASTTACQAISDFLANNDSIRFLDMSGYDSKLDEGRLGRGFSQALVGLRSNSAIQHLRVRSQMLNINVGDLAEAISANQTLHTLDCEGNDFNLSNFRHLVKHLEDNKTIRDFSAFTPRDLERCIRKCIDSASSVATNRRSSVISRFRYDKAPTGIPEGPLLQQLKDSWDSVTTQLEKTLESNRQLHRSTTEVQNESFPTPSSHEYDEDNVFAPEFGGLALKEFKSRKSLHARGGSIARDVAAVAVAVAVQENKRSRSYSSVSSEAVSPTTTDGVSSGSGVPTPPELESPTEREFAMSTTQSPEALVDEPQECDFEYTGGFDADPGLQMKSHRRFHSEPTSCIVEEDDSYSSK